MVSNDWDVCYDERNGFWKKEKSNTYIRTYSSDDKNAGWLRQGSQPGVACYRARYCIPRYCLLAFVARERVIVSWNGSSFWGVPVPSSCLRYHRVLRVEETWLFLRFAKQMPALLSQVYCTTVYLYHQHVKREELHKLRRGYIICRLATAEGDVQRFLFLFSTPHTFCFDTSPSLSIFLPTFLPYCRRHSPHRGIMSLLVGE